MNHREMEFNVKFERKKIAKSAKKNGKKKQVDSVGLRHGESRSYEFTHKFCRYVMVLYYSVREEFRVR